MSLTAGHDEVLCFLGCQVPTAAWPDPVRARDVQEDGRRQVRGHALRRGSGW